MCHADGKHLTSLVNRWQTVMTFLSLKEKTFFIAACYGFMIPYSSMTDSRQQQGPQKTGNSTVAPKPYSLPPITDAFESEFHLFEPHVH